MSEVASSRLVPSPPAMCGSETFAMLVSSNSMKVAIVRVKPIHHGFTARPLGVIAWLICSF